MAAKPPLDGTEPLVEEAIADRKERSLIAEGNVLAACCIFVSAVAFDALNALPTTVVADVPVSLRTTSLILCAVLASPPIEAHYLFEQRGLAFVLLALASWIGLHHGDVFARIADALYTLVGGYTLTLVYGVSGPKPVEKGYDGKGRCENVVALAAALLGYAGLRIVRAGISHATEVITFTSTHDDVSTRGYALADDVLATTLVFGGVICVATSIVVFLNHDLVYEYGCAPISSVIAMLSVFAFTVAFVVQLTSLVRLEELDVLFGDNSCQGARDVCEGTFRTRRMYIANSSPASLWACAVGMTVLAFPHDRRCRTRRDYFHPEERDHAEHTAKASGWVAIASAVVAVVAIGFFADSTAYLSSIELLLLYFSIPVAWFGQSYIACFMHAGGIALYTALRLGSVFGFNLTYLTHYFVLATLLVVLLLAITTSVSILLYDSFCFHGSYIVWIEWTTALALVALVSMQLLLTISSLGILSGYDGQPMTEEGKTWRATAFQWCTQHSISFFFAAALVGGRYEVQTPNIPRWVLRVVYFASPAVLTVAWIITMLASRSGVPYFAMGDVASLVIATVAALVPWIVVGVVVC